MHNQGNGKQALITGASSGIGREFARQLASSGYRLVLVARRSERLAALASDLYRQYGADARVLAADLANAPDIDRVADSIASLPRLSMLINSAGFGAAGAFAEVSLGRQLDMIQVHVVAGSHLTRIALPRMIARGEGAVINVSSLAALMPASANPTYCATKAYLLTLTESLHAELRGTGVKTQVLLPGLTYTEFYAKSEAAEFDYTRMPKPMWMSAEEVVRESLAALQKGRVICIPGLTNRLIATLARSGLTSVLWKMVALRLRTWLPRLLPYRPSASTELHPHPAARALFGGAGKARVALGPAGLADELTKAQSLNPTKIPPGCPLLTAALLPAPSPSAAPSPRSGSGAHVA